MGCGVTPTFTIALWLKIQLLQLKIQLLQSSLVPSVPYDCELWGMHNP